MVRTDDSLPVVIPNKVFIEYMIANESRGVSQRISEAVSRRRFSMRLGFAYGDIAKVRTFVDNARVALKEQKYVDRDAAYQVAISNVSKGFIEVSISVACEKTDQPAYEMFQNELLLTLVELANEAELQLGS